MLDLMLPNPIKFEDILGILKNDLAITPEIINAILPEPIADRYFPDGNIPTGNLSESAILAFVSLGGTVINPPPIPNNPARKPTGKAVNTMSNIKNKYSFDKIKLINLCRCMCLRS